VSLVRLSVTLLLIYIVVYSLGCVLSSEVFWSGRILLLAGASFSGIAALSLIKNERGFGRFYKNNWADRPISFIFLIIFQFLFSWALLYLSIILKVK